MITHSGQQALGLQTLKPLHFWSSSTRTRSSQESGAEVPLCRVSSECRRDETRTELHGNCARWHAYQPAHAHCYGQGCRRGCGRYHVGQLGPDGCLQHPQARVSCREANGAWMEAHGSGAAATAGTRGVKHRDWSMPQGQDEPRRGRRWQLCTVPQPALCRCSRSTRHPGAACLGQGCT